MTREELALELGRIEQALTERVEVWRVIVDEHGHETGQRIYRGSFQRPRDSRIGEPQQKENRS